jgi:F0F1-type ATP synthase membrane subunit b/b'
MPADNPAPGVVPFDLDGMADILRETKPELAKQLDVESEQPAEEIVPPPQSEAQPEPVVEEPAAEPEVAETPEPETNDTPSTLEDELAELNRQSSEAKSKTVAKPVEEQPKPAEAAKQRDDDLQLDTRQAAAMHPRTKKIIEERNQKIVTERNRAEALAKEKEELAAELNRARESLKKGVVPKETEEELTRLRERIRELDITRDPSLEERYDKPVSENESKIIGILQEFGVGKTINGKDDPEAIEKLKSDGITFKSISPYIKKLSDEGYEDEAEGLRELLRENIRVKNAKQKEISEWRTNFDVKKQQAAQFSQQKQEQMLTEVRDHATRILNSDLAELAKDFSFLTKPSEPLPSDSPAIAKAKQDALAAYEAASKSVSEAVAQLDASKAPPDRVSEIQGRLTANAVQNIVIRQQVLPRLMKDLADLKARNSELEAKVGKIKSAGTLSRAHAAAATSPAGAKTPLPESNEDAAKQIAREMGIRID